MNSKLKIFDSKLKWTYELKNETKIPISNVNDNLFNVQQLENLDDDYKIFDFKLSHCSQYLAIFEERVRKYINMSIRRKGRRKSDFRVKLVEINSGIIVFQSSELQRDFLHMNCHFSKDSNYLMLQGGIHGYLLVDIQLKKEFVFRKLEYSYYILQFQSINNFYVRKNDKIFHMDAEQINLQIEREICINFNYDLIFYFQPIFQKLAFISTELYQYIYHFQNLKVIKQRKKTTNVINQIVIFKDYLMIEQEDTNETDYSISLLNNGKLLRRVKKLFGESGNIYQDKNGVYKFNFTNIIDVDNAFYCLISKFDFLRGLYQEIPFKSNQLNQQISKIQIGNQIICLESRLKYIYVSCYELN